MIISPGRRYIFVHAPKTGGTAMALALEERAMKDDILIGDTPKALKRRNRLKGISVPGPLWKHSTLADVDGLVTRDMAAAFFIFTLVRNPWDRLVSYYHWLQAQDFAHVAVDLAKELPFREFVADRIIAASFRNAPAASYVTDAAGHCRAHFVRLEHLDTDLAPVAAHLGFPVELSRANASARHRDYRRYYDYATAELVADICAEDIAAFGYSFG
ncbi:sulfotransferase family 2 domain-containing protein [Pseudaestuariivita atlantica]|uniref:Type II secretory pathway, pullulanase PulA n=1 Tax=Pseudaestuariivita atlantica TaxID=1317121 RepID=A0A0L1JQU9_9RHOB|nr:sulfotransferase family 2 domain-containing protein [Pseudaestuariivita atlantica]KNG94164.1 Type II secretory pathway, pullulanase PulA [Pseudaestuariivita atlantica]